MKTKWYKKEVPVVLVKATRVLLVITAIGSGISIILMLRSIEPVERDSVPGIITEPRGWLPNWAIRTKEVDGCEYIILLTENNGSIVHKENCKNPIHEKNTIIPLAH